MKKNNHRGMSAGTILMLTFVFLVLGGSILVLSRLSSRKSVDLTKLSMQTLNLETRETEQLSDSQAEHAQQAVPTAAVQSARTAAPEVRKAGFSLTVGGTLAFSGELRKNSYLSESKMYDYTDTLQLIRNEFNADVNIVFLENLLSDDAKVNDTVAPGYTADVLKNAGIQYAACGFAKAFDQGDAGIAATEKSLQSRGIRALGIIADQAESGSRMAEYGGVKAAFLQYTGTVSSAVRKSMEKKGIGNQVPAAEAERIAEDIRLAREQGAEAVIVLLQWGKAGKAADKNQKALAQQIADAGADLIIGSGSRIPQGIERLNAADPRGGIRHVLCVWDPGCLMTGDRSSGIKRMAGYLFHITLRKMEDGSIAAEHGSWTPVYTWKYKQDGRFYYRCLPADGPVPDGMDSEQQKLMQRAQDAVTEALKNAPDLEGEAAAG